MTIAQIIDQLERDYGISTSRGTVGDDIKILKAFGIEIEVESSTQNRYYLISRRFDIPGLKTLIDAIQKQRTDQLCSMRCSTCTIFGALLMI